MGIVKFDMILLVLSYEFLQFLSIRFEGFGFVYIGYIFG